jgi:DNA polymerase-3 subunit chi
MTRIDFHFKVDDPLDYACRLARKIVRAGERAVFWCADRDLLARWDALLWTFSAVDFVAHVDADDPLAAETPILLTNRGIERPDRPLLISLAGPASGAPSGLVDGSALPESSGSPGTPALSTPTGPALPPYFSRYARLIELVSTAEADRHAARERWRFYRERGYEIHTHEVGRNPIPRQ